MITQLCILPPSSDLTDASAFLLTMNALRTPLELLNYRSGSSCPWISKVRMGFPRAVIAP